MRQERIIQATIFEVFAEHEIGRELKAISQWLDEHRALLSLAARDLRRHGIQETGRHGLPAEAVVRCALLKQYRQLSCPQLSLPINHLLCENRQTAGRIGEDGLVYVRCRAASQRRSVVTQSQFWALSQFEKGDRAKGQRNRGGMRTHYACNTHEPLPIHRNQ